MMDLNFLVDVNLPKYFGYFNKPNFFHVTDLDNTLTDNEIWNYAIQKKLIIITKDSDFYFRSLISSKRPKVVYFQLGNQTLKELHQYFEKYWHNIIEKLNKHSFILALPDKVKIVF